MPQERGRYSVEGVCTDVEDCGRWRGGYVELCGPCTEHYEKKYPQGWNYYPGDCCIHGTYVGGCGADLMCGACESGDDAPATERPEVAEDARAWKAEIAREEGMLNGIDSFNDWNEALNEEG